MNDRSETDVRRDAQTTGRNRRWAWIGLVAVLLFALMLIIGIIFFGAELGDPRGQEPGPGP